MTQLTDFGKEVRKRMIDVGMTTKMLCDEVREKTGMYCAPPYMSRLLNGVKNSEPIKAAICEILGMEET